VIIQSMRMTLYLNSDSTYPIHNYLQNNYKYHNSNDVYRNFFIKNMNFGSVIIELFFQVFEELIENFEYFLFKY
jgi:hypothetical protein